MLRPGPDVQVYLYADPVDMRKSIDGLSALIEAEMSLSPYTDALFVFCNCYQQCKTEPPQRLKSEPHDSH